MCHGEAVSGELPSNKCTQDKYAKIKKSCKVIQIVYELE